MVLDFFKSCPYSELVDMDDESRSEGLDLVYLVAKPAYNYVNILIEMESRMLQNFCD